MVRLRLQRYGTKKRPFYRLVAADARKRRDGRFIEQLGYYDPIAVGNQIKFKLDRVNYWVEKGARPSETVQSLLRKTQAAGVAV